MNEQPPKKKYTRPKRHIEREFGVPFAGEILEPSQWTQTALKKLPADGPLDLPALFGRSAPLVVDLGCGNGRFLIGSAVWRPNLDHFGIDILPLVLRYATRRANQRGLTNIRFAAIDAQRFLADLHRVLAPGGQLFVQTDNAPYWEYLRTVLPAFFSMAEQPAPWPDAPKGRTRREIIALRRGLPVFRARGTARSLSAEERLHLASTLPAPDFDAGPPA